MKKLFPFLLFLACTLFHMEKSLGQTTFTIRHQNENLSSIDIDIYQAGERVQNGYTDSNGEKTFDITSGYYKTETNHSGQISESNILLTCQKLTITLVDQENNPISSESIKIYENGNSVTQQSTNTAGNATFFLKPSKQYAYKCSFSQGAVSLLADTSITIKQSCFEIVAKYGDYPIQNESFSLYSTYNPTTSIASGSNPSYYSGKVKFYVPAGDYFIKNKLGIVTPVSFTDTNKTIYLEYKKVKFISQNNDPNILKNITVKHEGYSSENKITDGEGFAEFYLLPGVYTYTHLSGNGTFVVEDRDIQIDLTSYPTTIILQNPETGNYYPNFNFTIKYDGNNVEESFMTDNTGKCNIQLLPGEYTIVINEICSYTIESPSSGEINIPLYDIEFINKEANESDYISITNTNASYTFKLNTKYSFISNTYTYQYHCKNSLSQQLPLTLNSNTRIDINTNVTSVTIHVYDNGKPYTGLISFYGENFTTSTSGNCINGKLVSYLKDNSYYYVLLSSGPGYQKMKITDGMEIHLTDVLIQEQGAGLTFPLRTISNTPTKYIAGTNIRLSAIPMNGNTYAKWIINDTEYDTDMVEYTVPYTPVTATAVFEDKSTTALTQVTSTEDWNIVPNPVKDMIALPEEYDGDIHIYSSDGTLIQTTHIVGNQIDVSHLHTGMYLMILEYPDRTLKGKFIKE